MAPESFLQLTRMEDDEAVPLHPNLAKMVHGHHDVDALRRGVKRLENDLEDLEREPEELTEPPKHDIEYGTGTEGGTQSASRRLTRTATTTRLGTTTNSRCGPTARTPTRRRKMRTSPTAETPAIEGESSAMTGSSGSRASEPDERRKTRCEVLSARNTQQGRPPENHGNT